MRFYLSRSTTKPTKWPVHPMMTLISLSMHLIWPEFSLGAWGSLGSLATHLAHSEDSDQTGRMPRRIWVNAGCTGHFVCFVMLQLICLPLFQVCLTWCMMESSWGLAVGHQTMLHLKLSQESKWETRDGNMEFIEDSLPILTFWNTILRWLCRKQGSA